ncbi:MAG: hypothetical protein H6672_15250 [Anaerolineaceae bacterium]|nr:hypothetical protein [Anaerolineaceae bacterium]
MMIELDMNITKVKRNQALEILRRAKLMPDKFTAHRNHTFTARYLRDRAEAFESADEFEARLEKSDCRIAILKRPSPRLDRGKYISLKFTFAVFNPGVPATVERPLAKAS